jgi:hypothetical protein
MLLQELEDEIDRWQKDFASTASASSVHGEVVWVWERPRNKATNVAWKVTASCSALCCSVGVSEILQIFSYVPSFFPQGCEFRASRASGNSPLSDQLDIPLLPLKTN